MASIHVRPWPLPPLLYPSGSIVPCVICEMDAFLPLEACFQGTSAPLLAQPGLVAARRPASMGCMLPRNAIPDPWRTWVAAILIQWPPPDLQPACSSSSRLEAGQVSPRAPRRVLARCCLTDSGQSPRALQTRADHSAGATASERSRCVLPRVPRKSQRRGESRETGGGKARSQLLVLLTPCSPNTGSKH